MLGIDGKSVWDRIEHIPELRALYFRKDSKSIPEPAPTEAATLLRSPSELPITIPSADLGQMVAVTEKLLGGGFATLGVPEATIKKLRDLSALRIDAGAMLAVSLQDTHQLYYLQLLSLTARADEIRAQYLDIKSATYDPSLEPTDRMFWQRAHTEIVEQLGRGYDRMMAGTEAMVAIMKGKSNGKEPPTRAIKTAWQQQLPKSVARSMAAK